MPVYHGSCHCGTVRFRVETEIEELTRCDCSLCRRKNALMGQVHESGFTLLAGEAALGLYQWNQMIARHHFCTRCGIYTHHRKRSLPDHYGFNAWCLEDFDPENVPVKRLHGARLSLDPEGAQPAWSGPPPEG